MIVVDVRQLPGAPVASPPALTNQAEMPLSGFCDDGTAVGGLPELLGPESLVRPDDPAALAASLRCWDM